ncbi:hypothetical protein L226DRAFT_616397 [Lentinus tigrinus ALCF2SS1-7]|uniref:Uncharacterized protein n=1 Tax=Lentinus tigrinus ALCF2SS1-6 TaxID=1328759 RepID=A0A5C2RPM5_9APHY|nr:hypothetical protein L227DRAFT_605044 [Lentinus tigrinus ALCF2SS1-6]RPD69978.1 hypothetical protein L226DRAFT_616397 [Lentinus tigrinus ALCF2SS1-7]
MLERTPSLSSDTTASPVDTESEQSFVRESTVELEDAWRKAEELFGSVDRPQQVSRPKTAYISRTYSIEVQYEIEELSPDHGLCDDSESDFENMGRTPSPEPREQSVAPTYLPFGCARLGLNSQGDVPAMLSKSDFKNIGRTPSPARLGLDSLSGVPAMLSDPYPQTCERTLTHTTSRFVVTNAKPGSSTMNNAPRDDFAVPLPVRAGPSRGLPPAQPQARAQRRPVSQLRPVSSSARGPSGKAEAVSVAARRQRRSTVLPSGPPRRSERLAAQA